MRLKLTSLVIVSTGAFCYWALSGFKGTFNDHMSRYYDYDTKFDKNYWTGLGLLFFAIAAILGIATR